jgi:hypothetical protein
MPREIVAQSERVGPCKAVKSTLLLGSLQALRRRGHYDRYLEVLAPSARDDIKALAAPTWVPVSLAEAHYGACDSLRMSVTEMLAMGAESSRVNAVGVHALVGLARVGGADVWTLLDRLPSSWKLMYLGGDLQTEKTGPKDARVFCTGNCLARFAYWRTGMRGVGESIFRHFCTRVFIKESDRRSKDSVTFSISWA